MPSWALPLAVVVGLALVGIVVVRALSGPGESAPGPSVKVHAGMYDFRKEAEKGNLGRRPSDAPDAAR